MTPGKQIGQKLKTGDIMMKDVDVGYITAWEEGLLWFENTKRSEWIPSLERQYGVTIKYPETERNAAFSGKISVDNGLDYLFYLLSQTTGIECAVNDNEIHLIKRN